ncbi:MAG: hypothetical protein R2939_17175 [Kofleriaceae bacterium]
MSERDPQGMARLQAVVTGLIRHRVETSLADVEAAIARWRAGELSALEAHGVVLRHAARCERTVERVTSGVGDKAAAVVRDAFDAGLIDEAEFTAVTGQAPAEVGAAGVLRDDDGEERDKRAAVEELLERGPVLVHVDARRDDVVVPARFAGDPRLILRFGYRLTPAIVDLVVDDAGIAGTLTFGGMPFFCRLPWAGVYAVVVEGEQRGMVWPEDIPEVVLDKQPDAVVGAGPKAAPAATEPPPVAEAPAKPRGHLKLVD